MVTPLIQRWHIPPQILHVVWNYNLIWTVECGRIYGVSVWNLDIKSLCSPDLFIKQGVHHEKMSGQACWTRGTLQRRASLSQLTLYWTRLWSTPKSWESPTKISKIDFLIHNYPTNAATLEKWPSWLLACEWTYLCVITLSFVFFFSFWNIIPEIDNCYKLIVFSFSNFMIVLYNHDILKHV